MLAADATERSWPTKPGNEQWLIFHHCLFHHASDLARGDVRRRRRSGRSRICMSVARFCTSVKNQTCENTVNSSTDTRARLHHFQ